MRNLLTVLKKLGKKMTGEDITGKNLVTVVDDIAEKYTSGGGGEGGGGGITVVETTVTGDIYVDNAVTFTNATALFDMFEDVAANPEKAFKYGIVLYDNLESITTDHPKYNGAGIEFYGFLYYMESELRYVDIARSRSDITADDTLVFSAD